MKPGGSSDTAVSTNNNSGNLGAMISKKAGHKCLGMLLSSNPHGCAFNQLVVPSNSMYECRRNADGGSSCLFALTANVYGIV